MGELSETLEEFQEISLDFYQKIMKILEEKYCWKCPQRSTSGKIACREVDAWIRLIMSLEQGISDFNSKENSSPQNNLMNIDGKFLDKISKKSNSRLLFLKVNENKEPYLKKGNILMVRENSTAIKKDDLVLISQICPLAQYFYLKMDLSTLSWQIAHVAKIFHEDGLKYVETSTGSKIPFSCVMGSVEKIISKKDHLYDELQLNRL